MTGKNSIAHELNFIRERIQGALLSERTMQFAKLYDFPKHLFPFSDLADHFLSISKRKYSHVLILYYTNDLLLHEWNTITLNLISGAHGAAARTLRWILETTLGATAAAIDGSILDNSKPHKPLSLTGFADWLRKHDNDSRQYSISRRKILQALMASPTEISGEEQLYSDLCKYSHPSETSFLKRVQSGWFDVGLNTNYPLFDKVYKLALRTVDYVLFAILKAFGKVTQMRPEYIGFVDSYGYHNFGLNMPARMRKHWVTLRPEDLPVTWKTIIDVARLDTDSFVLRGRRKP